MVDPNLVAGDRVVDLAASLRSSAIIAGAIACAVSVWIVQRNVLLSIAGVFVGGIFGFCIGFFLAQIVFPSVAGKVVVVKLGQGALLQTLKGNLIGATISGGVVAAISAVLFGQMPKVMLCLGIGSGIGVVLGVILAYLATQA